MLTAAQVRGARAMIGMKQVELAGAAGIPRSILAEFEGGRSAPRPATLDRIRAVFESLGVSFINGDAGVGVVVKTRG